MELPSLGVLCQSLTDTEQETYRTLSDEAYGTALAANVAKKLKQNPSSINENGHYTIGGGLYHAHRDYCGIGLYFLAGKLRLQWYLEEQYSPVWNAYSLYAREKSDTP